MISSSSSSSTKTDLSTSSSSSSSSFSYFSRKCFHSRTRRFQPVQRFVQPYQFHQRRQRQSSWKRPGQPGTVIFISSGVLLCLSYLIFYHATTDLEWDTVSTERINAIAPLSYMSKNATSFEKVTSDHDDTVFESPPVSIGNCDSIQWSYYHHDSNSYIPFNKYSNGIQNQDKHKSNLVYHHKPIFVPSFPGSGAELFRKLVETMTGGVKGWSSYFERNRSGYQSCPKVHAATCKTHFPVLDHIVYDDDDDTNGTTILPSVIKFHPLHEMYKRKYDDSIILLLRNPRNAFASRLNHLWEMKNNVQFHSQQAPERAWNRWIAKNFHQQVTKYQELIRSWALLQNKSSTLQSQTNPVLGNDQETAKMKRVPSFLSLSEHYRVALVVPYEGLIDPVLGPDLVKKLILVFQRARVPRVVSFRSIPCLWQWVVKGDKGPGKQTKRSGYNYTPAYTKRQQEIMVNMVDELINDFERQVSITTSSADLVTILSGYRQDIASSTPIITP